MHHWRISYQIINVSLLRSVPEHAVHLSAGKSATGGLETRDREDGGYLADFWVYMLYGNKCFIWNVVVNEVSVLDASFCVSYNTAKCNC